ncbi:MAG: MotA/TolQ/ExbB proton channel family protein [Prolixibacteraceae bacterium]
MKDLFFMGGTSFMGILTLLLIITTAWIIYHFIKAYNSKQADLGNCLRKLVYGKSMGLFTLMVGILGSLVGLSSMFSAIEEAIQRGEEIIPGLIFHGIKTTLICPMYGIVIYLFALVLWFVASILIEKKFEN